MTVFLVGYKPSSDPTASLAAATRQYTSRAAAGAYNNTIPFFRQAVTGDRITKAWFFIRASAAPTPGSTTMTAYVTNSAGTSESTRVDPGWTISTTSGTGAWVSVDLNIDLTSFAGQYIKPSGGYANGAHRYYATCTTGDSVSVDADRPNPFGTATGRANLMAMYLEITSAENITSINSGNPVKLGSTFGYTHSGFSPSPTSATLDGVALTGVTSSQATAPSLQDNVVLPRMNSRSFSATNGTQTAAANTLVIPPDEWDYVELAGTLSTGNYSWIPTDAGAAVGDFMIFQTSISGQPTGTDIRPDGEGGTNHEGQQMVYFQKGTTGLTKSYLVITGPGGEVISIQRTLAAVGLSAVGISASGLAVVGL